MVYIKRLESMSSKELLDIIKIRLESFVVEQDCVYLDIDEIDYNCYHVYVVNNDNKIVGVSRIYLEEDYVVFGRFTVSKEYRGLGYAKLMIDNIIQFCLDNYPNKDIRISAQVQASPVYAKHGFIINSAEYLLDNIPHVKMIYTHKG